MVASPRPRLATFPPIQCVILDQDGRIGFISPRLLAYQSSLESLRRTIGRQGTFWPSSRGELARYGYRRLKTTSANATPHTNTVPAAHPLARTQPGASVQCRTPSGRQGGALSCLVPSRACGGHDNQEAGQRPRTILPCRRLSSVTRPIYSRTCEDTRAFR